MNFAASRLWNHRGYRSGYFIIIPINYNIYMILYNTSTVSGKRKKNTNRFTQSVHICYTIIIYCIYYIYFFLLRIKAPTALGH